MLLVSVKLKAVFQTDTLYSCLLSLVSLSLWSLTHTPIVVYIYMLHSNWEQFSFQPALHGACATQSHSFHPLTIHSSICLQTHSHSTDHSLILQAHAIIPLHLYSGKLCIWFCACVCMRECMCACVCVWERRTLITLWNRIEYVTRSHEMSLNLKFGNLRYLHVSNLQVLLVILILKSRFYSKKCGCDVFLKVWRRPFWENPL